MTDISNIYSKFAPAECHKISLMISLNEPMMTTITDAT